MLEHEPLTTLLRLLHIGMHPLKDSRSLFWNPLRLAKVSKPTTVDLFLVLEMVYMIAWSMLVVLLFT